MATRFRDLVQPALIDLAARSTPSGGSEQALQTAQVFSNFSRQAASVGNVFRAEAGAREGAEAGASGDPQLRTGLRSLSSYGKAYNNAALRSYAIRSEQDLEQQAARLEVEAGTNPQAFLTAMEEVQKATIENAPLEARAVLQELYTSRTTQGLARIQAGLATELREEDRTLVNERIESLTDEIASLKAQDTQAAFIESQVKEGQLSALIAASSADNTISETEAAQALRAADRKIVFSTVMERFKNEIDSPYGDPIGFIEDLKAANRESDALPSEDEQRLENAMLAELRERNSLASMRESLTMSARTARHLAGDRNATMELLAGNLSQQDLLRKVSNDEISSGMARTFLNELQSQATAPARSDQRELATVRLNLLNTSEADIVSNPLLTYDDRADLILQRRNEEAGWKGTQRAREAFARIDRALGIVPGTNINMLSTEEREARDVALTRLYDVVDALPPEERDGAVLLEADRVITTVIRENASTELERQQQELEKLLRQDTSGFDSRQKQRYDDKIERMRNNIRELQNQTSGGGN